MKCVICGKNIPKNNRKYCSMRCRNIGTTGEGNPYYGKTHTETIKNKMRGKRTPLSTEHKKKLSEAHKWETGENNPFYGRKHTIESRKKMSNAGKGRIKTSEHRQKIGDANKGRIITDSTREKQSLTMKKLYAEGKIVPPNKDTTLSETHKKNISIAKKGKPNLKLHGKVASAESRKKMSATRKRLIAEGKIILPKLPFPNNKKNSNTKPERIVKKYLLDNGLVRGKDFYQNYWINIDNKYRADFLFPSIKTIIECDGNYFHANDNSVKKELVIKQKEQIIDDDLRTRELRDKGYVVLRFWEVDIKKNFRFVAEAINEILIKLYGVYV